MMNENLNELLRQIKLGEDSSLELKNIRYKGNRVSSPHRDSMADELAAMANTASGVFVLGVDDKSKSPTGIPEEKLDIVQIWIENICNDLIDPPLLCRIRKIPVSFQGDDESLVIIRVDIPKSVNVHQSPGGYFHRIGSSKRRMTTDVLTRFLQQRSQAKIVRFDEQSVASAPRDCLEKELWEKFRTSLSPSEDEEFLLKLGLFGEDEDGLISPSVSGILMATEEPREFIANAFIQAVSYRGTERNSAHQIDARDINGPLDIQIADACKFVEKNMRVYAVKEPARHDIPQYSMQAVFEALVNAVAHRDYSIQSSKIRIHMFSDRLEIFSPGAIPNTMTIESLKLRQACRNELLTSLLARCPMPFQNLSGERQYIMDKRGEGVPIIFSESEKLSGRLPEYRLIDDSELMLTIFAAKPPSKKEFSLSELRELSTEKLVQTLATHERNGLAEKVKQLIKTSPLLYHVDLVKFKDLDLAYVHAVIEAYSELWKEKAHVPWKEIWHSLLEFCSEVVKPELYSKERVPHRYDASAVKRGWVVSEIAQLLASGAKSDEYAFDEDIHGDVESLISYLLDSEKGEEFREEDDKVITAINSPRGWCILALISLTLRSCSLSDIENDKDHSRVWGKFQHYYDAELRRADIGEFEFSTLVTMNLPSFIYMSREWVRTNLKVIFDQENYMKWLCAMEGYYYVKDVYEEVYRHLRKNGDFLKALDDNKIQQQVKSRIIENIAIAYINDFENLEDRGSLISALISRKDFRELNNLINFVGKYPKVDDDKLRKKVYELWPVLVDLTDFSTKQNRMLASSLCRWADFVDYLDDERKKILLKIAPYADESHNSDSLLKSIARFSSKQPFEANEIWLKMLDGVALTCPEEAILQILSNLLSQGDDGELAAKDTVDKYMKRGVKSPSKLLSEAINKS